MNYSAPIANDNSLHSRQAAERLVDSDRRSGRPLKIRLLHEEAPALKGLMAAFRNNGCEIQATDIEPRLPGTNEGDIPDLCIIGNLDACNEALIRSLRMSWPSTYLVLFDLSLRDETDLAKHADAYRVLGLDGFLPASSSMQQIRRRIQKVLADSESGGGGGHRLYRGVPVLWS